MNKYKVDAMKDKAIGSIEEVAGKVTDDKKLEYKGKARKNLGKARGFVGELQDQTEDMKDMVAGTVKEKAGEITHLKPLELKGKAEKAYAEVDRTEKILFGLGMFSLIMFLIGFIVTFSRDEE